MRNAATPAGVFGDRPLRLAAGETITGGNLNQPGSGASASRSSALRAASQAFIAGVRPQ
jgi:hypothetical protein